MMISDKMTIAVDSAPIAANPMLPAVEYGTLRPILFSTPMVQAILAGRKTQTRRIIKPQPDDSGLWNHDKFPMSLDSELNGWWGTVDETGESKEFKCPFGWGGQPYLNNSTLWVRETYRAIEHSGHGSKYFYKADACETDLRDKEIKWKPSIFMPLAACRIFLKVTNVKVERVQDISNADAFKEGIEWKIKFPDEYPDGKYYRDYMFKDRFAAGILFEAKHSFKSLWFKINGRESWENNPFVWVVEFERCVHP